jgi:hypothetical protein
MMRFTLMSLLPVLLPGLVAAQERVERTTGTVRLDRAAGTLETVATDYGCTEIKLPLESVQSTLRADPVAVVDWIMAARAFVARAAQVGDGERRSITGPELKDATGSTVRMFREAEHARSRYTLVVVSRAAGHPEIEPLISSIHGLSTAQLTSLLANLQKAVGWTRRYSNGRRCLSLGTP